MLAGAFYEVFSATILAFGQMGESNSQKVANTNPGSITPV